MDKGESANGSPGPLGATDYRRIAEQIASRQPNVDELQKSATDVEGTVT